MAATPRILRLSDYRPQPSQAARNLRHLAGATYHKPKKPRKPFTGRLVCLGEVR